MTTWAVNWIEQDQIYKNLLEAYETRLVQATPVTIQSFSEPTQEEWEDAYVRQTNRIPPILPGKLRWLDLRNGTVKSYTTIYKDGGIEIDPVVRPTVSRAQSWGCIRLLGVSKVGVNGLGWPLDQTTWINKGLLMVIVMSPDAASGNDTTRPGGSYWLGWQSSKVGAAAASNGTTGLGGLRFKHSAYLFNPSTELLGDELVHRNSHITGMSENVYGNTLELNMGAQYGDILIAGTTPPQAQGEIAGITTGVSPTYIYGVFQSDPGYIEEFELV